MYPWLEDAIERNVTVITANRRLARELRNEYATQKIEAGVLSWLTPSIHFFGDWCRRQFESHADPRSLPVLIDGFSSSILWDRCLKAHAPEELPAFGGFLDHARDAWQRIADWKVPLDAVAKAARSAEEQSFASAAGDYREILDAASWADMQGIPGLVTNLLSNRKIDAPGETVFAGFDHLAPAVLDLIASLEAAGCAVQMAPEPEAIARVRIAAFDDHDAELRAAGAWARMVLQEEPCARIAIISPQLQKEGGRKSRLIREGLAPGWQYGDASYGGAVNISYGRKLADFPAIAIALTLIKWTCTGLATKDISLLLRTRCLVREGTAGRSRLELLLRRFPDRAWRAGDIRRLFTGRDENTDALAWMRGVDAVIALQEDAQREASPAWWASRIDALLDAWSWPGAATLSSNDFQLVNRWRHLLNEFARTSMVMPQLRLSEATERLAALANDVVFQAETGRGLVALMGTLEAAGMRFDHAWVCGLHAGQWPPPGSPLVFLSRDLQRQYGMPDATPADTLRFSRHVLQRLVKSAPDVVLSWPQSDGESELAASSLLDEIPHETWSGPSDPGWHALDFCNDDAMQVISKDPAPPVAHDEVVRGGAYTVQRQTIEPFSAFVYGRLGVKRADAIEAGIAARVRGNIIHDALQTLLAEHPTQAEIKRWSKKDVEQRVGAAIDTALARPLRHADATYSRLLGIERRRLFSLLREFIATEAGREAFSVADVEKTVDFEAIGVRLEHRIDRIDRLADGSMFIIDYKTGSPKSLLDKDGGPKEIQLVVYAEALDDTVGGIALVNVDSRSISYRAVGSSTEWDSATPDEWAERLAGWLEEVRAALREIAAGDVRINLLLSAEEGRPLSLLSRLEEMKRA